MDDVKLKLNEKGHGAFYLMNNAKQMGEMVVSVAVTILLFIILKYLRKQKEKVLQKRC